MSDVTVTLNCLFCRSPLKGQGDAKYSSGDLIKCKECGEENDFDSVLAVAKEEGLAQIKGQIEKELSERLKGLFK